MALRRPSAVEWAQSCPILISREGAGVATTRSSTSAVSDTARRACMDQHRMVQHSQYLRGERTACHPAVAGPSVHVDHEKMCSRRRARTRQRFPTGSHAFPTGRKRIPDTDCGAAGNGRFLHLTRARETANRAPDNPTTPCPPRRPLSQARPTTAPRRTEWMKNVRRDELSSDLSLCGDCVAAIRQDRRVRPTLVRRGAVSLLRGRIATS